MKSMLASIIEDIDEDNDENSPLSNTTPSAPAPASPIDEIDRYLSSGALKNIPNDNATEWWTAHRDEYPRLSYMALDYLSIPGT